jgi:FkbM family methyltransferase
MTEFHVFGKLRRAPVNVRRFGVLQASLLLLPELTRTTRLLAPFNKLFGGFAKRYRTRDSMVLWLRPFSMDLGIFHEVWDHERYTAGPIGEVARQGTVVDIGAHIGLFSVLACKVLQANRVVSVEPDHSNFTLLSRNIAENHVKNPVLIEAAIAGRSGEEPFYTSPSNTGGHSLRKLGRLWRPTRTLSLSDLFASNAVSECSLLKMDCEGSEMDILESTGDQLLSRVRAIAFEYHLDAYQQERLERFRRRMETLGFKLEVRPTGKTLGIIRGIR